MAGEPEYTAIGYESVVVSTTAIGIASTVVNGSVTRRGQRALVTVETATIRFRYDGTDPTSTEGHVADPGDALEIVGFDNIDRFSAIRISTATADAIIKVSLENY